MAKEREGIGIDIARANEYANGLARDEDEVLQSIARYCRDLRLPHINPEEGRVLGLLIQMIQAKRVLEVGTCSGYSTIWMARALPEDGLVETIEVDPGHAKAAAGHFKKAGVEKKIKIHEGAALDIMPKLQETSYDLVFIDAEKSEYSDYLSEALRLVHKGSLICADNVFWQGRVFADDVDDDTESIKYFTKRIFSNQRLRSTLIPVSDGLSVSLVRS